MRKLIAAMKLSLDGRFADGEDMATWVDAWSDDYGLTPEIDACIIGAGMYPGYERYWTGIQTEPDTPAWITGAPPTAAEREWAQFITRTPHYVLSSKVMETLWPETRFLHTVGDIAALKAQPGRHIYLMGGGQTIASLIDAGLVDELRLIVYPLICGDGRDLFAHTHKRHDLSLQTAQAQPDGRLSLTYSLN